MKRSLYTTFAALAAATTLLADGVAATTLNWTTANNTVSTVTNQLRAVAVADQPGNDSVYIAYIQTTGNRRVDRLDLNSPYSVLNTHASGPDQPKGIATDDRGNVFVANRNSGSASSFIQSFSATLGPNASSPTAIPTVGGLAIQKVGATYYAYTVYEDLGLIQRYDVTNPAAMTLDATFGVAGSYSIPGGDNLRGVEVGADGSIYVAARDDNAVYKVSADLSTVSSFPLNRAMDVALYGSKIYATSYDGANSFIRVIESSNMAFVEDITITTLDGNPYSRGTNEGWSGIDIDAAGNIWLADQRYGDTGGTQDRLLRGSTLAIPEPASVALATLAVAGMVFARRRNGRLTAC